MPSELAYCALYPLKKTPRPEVKAFIAWLVSESRAENRKTPCPTRAE
jgi:hypothetical protein